jgi:hypothetical protein
VTGLACKISVTGSRRALLIFAHVTPRPFASIASAQTPNSTPHNPRANMARSSTTTGTPDLGKVWNLELSSPFDPYNNSSISTAPSSMDRIKKRSQGRGLSPNPSTPGPSSSPYLGSSAARSASYLPLSSSVPDLPSRKGSCATNRSLMSDPPDTWEDQVANDSGRDETPDSKHQSRPAVSKSRSFMDRFRSKPKQGTLHFSTRTNRSS